MPDQKPTLDYAIPNRRRWPWWGDVLFALAVVLLAWSIIAPMLATAGPDFTDGPVFVMDPGPTTHPRLVPLLKRVAD